MPPSSADLLRPVHESWLPALEPHLDTLARIRERLSHDARAGTTILPAPERVLRVCASALDDVRVLIVGQDPYPTPGHAVGWAFSVEPDVRPLPGSLRNILTELHDDVGIPRPTSGDLSAWVGRGVFLLNRVLTVPAGNAGGHRGLGWEVITAGLVEYLGAHNDRFVAALWGRDAASLEPVLGATPVTRAAHPSPLSAHRGFLGSRPFTAINAALAERGQPPMNWSLAVTP